MQDIKDLNLEELEERLKSWDKPAFHARQIFSWIYEKGAVAFDRMSNLPLDLRKKLEENFDLYRLKIGRKSDSKDGTEKFLFELKDKNYIEGVSIPTENRTTGCISTQAGCKFACRFCASGVSGFKRNLNCGEMLEEALYLKNHSKGKRLTHIVFMGTGEPLDNYDNVMKAIRIMNSQYALSIGARRITISTSGVIPAIKRLAEEVLQIELSVSLHAASDETRSKLMPINKIYPLKELISACRSYNEQTGRQVTFEYILIKDVNSGLKNAQKLGRLLKGADFKVNIIPCNPVAELKVQPPAKHDILAFRDHLSEAGINVTLRKPRGEDIEAACGQLRLKI
jgi:23S rRNA (adenine2503-C2)-methyltransferase